MPAFPECDEDLFLDSEQAQLALKFYMGTTHPKINDKTGYRIISHAVPGQVGGGAYRRWLAEVKNQHYQEPRRSLQESHALYLQWGRAGLKSEYAKAYVYALLRKFKAAGLSLHPEEQSDPALG